ncbi:MAG: GDSL-type esterase/lipase family protein [Chitinophagaceae bacterium]
MTRFFHSNLSISAALFLLSVTLISMSGPVSNVSPGRSVGADTMIAKDSTGYPEDSGYATSYLALGDSYTIGQSVPHKERYPFQTVDLLQKAGYRMRSADIIATTGWTTADLMEGIKEKAPDNKYDLVSLLIGVNDQYQRRSLTEYRNHFTILLKKSIKLAGNRPSRVFVLSIPDYSVTPFANNYDRDKISREIDMFNRENKRIAGMYKVNYLNITPESRKAFMNKSLVAYDDLHFSGKEYSIWASMLVPMITKVLK